MGRFQDWRTMHSPRQKYLTRAAGVSVVLFVCQPDTWRAVASLAETVEIPVTLHGGLPDTHRDDGLSEVRLTGVNLVEILQAMRTAWTAKEALGLVMWEHKYDPGQRAIAQRVYLGVARTLDHVESYQVDGTPMPPIVIDDRARPGSAA